MWFHSKKIFAVQKTLIVQVFNMDKVNVLYCFNSKLWRMAAVSMESLLSNTKSTTQLTIYCLVEPGTKGRRKINKIIKSHKNGAVLVWIEVDSSKNPFQTEEYAKFGPPVGFYRCIAHRFLKDVDKVLYLTTVTLIYHDLAELFNTDVSDYAFGAVYDMAPINDANNAFGVFVKDFSAKYLNNGPYYNAGVLLLNLKAMAQNEQRLFETKIPLSYPAQDLLNVSFAGKIKRLPLKYNLAPATPIPPQFTPEEAAEVNSGGHVIVDCYYVWPYDKERSNKLVYDTFTKHAKNIGMSTEMFIKADEKSVEVKKTFVPHVKIRRGKVLFFGIKIDD